MMITSCMFSVPVLRRVAAIASRSVISPKNVNIARCLVGDSAPLIRHYMACQLSISSLPSRTLPSKTISGAGRGIWIRPRQRASKRMWKKSQAQRRRQTHVFCNATQSTLLDKMVTRYWKKMRHYPDDPYRPYMKRESHRLSRGYPREYF